MLLVALLKVATGQSNSGVTRRGNYLAQLLLRFLTLLGKKGAGSSITAVSNQSHFSPF